MINFANEGLVSISCDCLQHDEHTVSNLIARDISRRKKGFIADRFIKPPANISLTFKCDVDISKIVLNTRVGTQKSSGFEIFKVLRNKSSISIASVIVNEKTDRVVFSRDEEETNARCVKFCSARAAECVREIKLKVFKTAGSTLPALGSLDIWGIPSGNVPHHVKVDVDVLWTSICDTGGLNVHGTLPKNLGNQCSSVVGLIDSSPENNGQGINVCSPEIKVPEEFIDPISCEIMTIPMTLPSGNIVDVATLEKYHQAECKHGRGRSDPFTGVLFTEWSQPVVATSLKSRLDKFLLENCDAASVKTLPRTLGRKPETLSGPSKPLGYDNILVTCGKLSAGSSTNKRGAESVDQLLDDCLEGLPSYLNQPPPPKKLNMGCGKCNSSAVKIQSYVFKLPCQHTICRVCLCTMRQNEDNLCSECNKPFTFNTVVRHNF